MDYSLLTLYHRLPSPARSAAATLRGYYLRFWRYGPATRELAEAARERDSWSGERWHAWREERLAEVLHRAATRVPYYREEWSRRRRRGDGSSWELLENWPLLEKEAVRRNPRAFVADDCDIRRLFREQTSGTTGKPLEIWRSRGTLQGLYALSYARTRRWNDVSRDTRWGRLGGQLVVPVRQRRPPFWVWNAAMRQLYMSSYHLGPDLIPHYLDAIARYRIEYLAGYTSSLVALAQQAVRNGRCDLRMRVAFTNAEPLDIEQRKVIAEAFQCAARETYGMTETVAAASECREGRLHYWPEVGHVEVWRDGRPAGPGEQGELVCTGLLNTDMPFIRYRVGDSGRLPADSTPCPCGRGLPLIAGIDGRTTDALLTPDGRKVFRFAPVFYGLPVREAQIIQDRLDSLRVLVAPAPEYSTRTARMIAQRIRERVGPDMEIALSQVPVVPRSANGKLRLIVCKLSAGEREAAAREARPRPPSPQVQ